MKNAFTSLRATRDRSSRATLSIVFGCLLLLPATGWSGAFETFLDLDVITGESDSVGVAAYDAATGLLTIARRLESAQPEWRYVPVRRYSNHVDSRFILAVDLDGDRRSDIVIPAYGANKLLVIWGKDLDQSEIIPEQISVGPGPTAVTLAGPAGDGSAELLIATTGSAQVGVGVRGWNVVAKQPTSPLTTYPTGFSQEGMFGFATVGAARNSLNPTLGILRRDAGSGGLPVFESFARDPLPLYGALNSIQATPLDQPFTEMASGYPLGDDRPGWFVVWSPKLTSVAMFPSGAGGAELVDLGEEIREVQVHAGTHSGGVNVLLGDGSVRFYEFIPGDGLTLLQQFTPPAGLRFGGMAGSDGRLTLFAVDEFGDLAHYQIWAGEPGGYELIARGNWPAAPALTSHVSVVHYAGDPFGLPTPLVVETFSAGDWATSAEISGGQIAAWVETDGGVFQGLGNPVFRNLLPSVAPGAGSVALGNQWEPSSSLFHANMPVLNGPASLGIDPPPGHYPHAIAVWFQPGSDVTSHYRVNLGAWQTGPGPGWLTQSATVEYYGQHNSGALSPIRSAAYHIDQANGVDSDGDGVPDEIEILAGTNPFSADTDGDGASDFAELRGGSDPLDPASTPGGPVVTFDELVVRFAWDDELSTALPGEEQALFLSDPAHPENAATTVQKLPGVRKFGDVTLKRGVVSSKAWLPSSYAVELPGGGTAPVGQAMTALVGIEFPPRPEIVVDTSAADPLGAWLTAVQDVLNKFHAEPREFTIGPASGISALIFEYWFGLRLVDLGHLPDIHERPRIADTPRSPYVDALNADHVRAIEHPEASDQAAYQVSRVIQQINEAVQHEPGLAPLREIAETLYAQAIEAALSGSPLDPPLNALRTLLDGASAPTGYVLPYTLAEIVALRDQTLAGVDARPQSVLHGTLLFAEGWLILETGPNSFNLVNAAGKTWRPSGLGRLVAGAGAEVRGFVLDEPAPPGFVGELEVLRVTITSLPEPGYEDIDGNGLPDAWQYFFLGQLGTSLGNDADGNGFLDVEEYWAGTDPMDALDVPPGYPATPRNLRIVFPGSTMTTVEWEGSFTVGYEILSSDGLLDWQAFPTTIVTSGDRFHAAPVDGDADRFFYRVRIVFPSLP